MLCLAWIYKVGWSMAEFNSPPTSKPGQTGIVLDLLERILTMKTLRIIAVTTVMVLFGAIALSKPPSHSDKSAAKYVFTYFPAGQARSLAADSLFMLDDGDGMENVWYVYYKDTVTTIHMPIERYIEIKEVI
jgi:hypothetical protein